MTTLRLRAAIIGLAAILTAGFTATATAQEARSAGPSPIHVAGTPQASWDFVDLAVLVPRTLSVSEAHGIKPRADIVWREDPVGDRHAQVGELISSALEPALAPMSGSVPVQVVLQVTRFHALTERARYTIGGQHEIEFVYVVRHAETGAVLSGPTAVDLTFRAYGGRQAVEAEQKGITQRRRITERLMGWAQQEFPVLGRGAPASGS